MRRAEERRDERFDVRLLGRFMRSDRKEFDCESIEASADGITFSADAGVQPGERIVAYLNQIGRVEGRVTRIFANRICDPDAGAAGKRDKLTSPIGLARQAAGARTPRGPAPRAHRAARPVYAAQAAERTRIYRDPDRYLDVGGGAARRLRAADRRAGGRRLRRRPRSCVTSIAESRLNS